MLEKLFAPRAVAVVGASRNPEKLGFLLLRNLIESGFPGKIYPVNPGAGIILGLEAYTCLEDIPGPVDLAVVATPARTVVDILEACGRLGVGAAVVLSAGFRETGHEGLMAERRIAEIAQAHGMKVLGPNCLGLIDTFAPMNASFGASMPRRGAIAFMSQSGALCTSILDMSLNREIGFSQFVSLGNKADLNEIDFIEAWAEDPRSSVIMAYVEGIADGARFIETARRVTKTKPIVAIKSGVTHAGSRAVSSHTGTLAGSEQAYDAAFRQSGVIRARSVGHLFDVAVALACQPLPRSDRVAVITNAGGPAIMATDAIEKAGMALATFSAETTARLRAAFPPAASVLNPVDILGDARADRYRAALQGVLADPGVGAVLVILTPQVMTEVEATAQTIVDLGAGGPVPILSCFMGEGGVKAGVDLLMRHHIPNFTVPEEAVAALTAMAQAAAWQKTQRTEPEFVQGDREQVGKAIARARAEGRLEIGEAEARAILEAYGIPMPPSQLCRTADEAVAFAERIGYPVVMKISSPDILHKTDIGGVRLDVSDPKDVRDSFELLNYRAARYMPDAEVWGCVVQRQLREGKEVIVGMNRDPQFGPLVMFGLGGVYVEVLKDVSYRIAPFSRSEAMEMIGEIKTVRLLHGVRGEAPSDVEALAETLLRVSQMVTDFPEILEMDINPLMVFDKGRGVMAVDARFVLAS